jgi:hypothetical protein
MGRTDHEDLPEVIFTVGHSNRSLDQFLKLLEAHRVSLVADVRKMPGSTKNPQFNREALSLAVHEAGIDYVHLPGLGGLRRPPAWQRPAPGSIGQGVAARTRALVEQFGTSRLIAGTPIRRLGHRSGPGHGSLLDKLVVAESDRIGRSGGIRCRRFCWNWAGVPLYALLRP